MESDLLKRLETKSITKEGLFNKVEHNFDLLPEMLKGISSSKATVRYGCAKVLMDLSVTHPERLYPYMDSFVALLDSKYRILTWNALAIIANLTRVDKNKKFDAIFDRYYSLLDDDYMVTVANTVGNSAKIAQAKPYLTQKITDKLLRTERLPTTLHLTEECKRVIAEKTIDSFSQFFNKIENKEKVIAFVSKHCNSPRKTLKKKADTFLKNVNQGTRRA